MMVRVLIVGVEPGLVGTLESNLQGEPELDAWSSDAQVRIELVRVDSETLWATLSAAADEIGAVVVGRRVADRPAIASRIRNHDARLASILLAGDEELETLVRSLRLAPSVGRHVRCLPADSENLPRELRKAVLGTARRRRLQASLDAMTSRLEQAQAAPRFVASQPFVDRLLDELPVGVLLIDSAGRVAACNPCAEGLLEEAEESLVGRHVGDFLHPSENGEVPDLLARLDPGQALDLRVGASRVVAARASRFESGGHEPAQLVVLEDVTDQRNLEDRLRHGAKMEAVGQLAGGIAHHFNNLLTVILGHADDLRCPEERGKAGRRIRQAAERAAELTRQLLAFGERQLVRPVPLLLSELVKDVLPLLERSLGEDIRVTAHLRSEEERAVRVDRGQLEQVLVTLVLNARDAMPEGGEVTIEVTSVDEDSPALRAENQAVGSMRLVVTDTGVGMSEANRARVFEPFFTTKNVGQGSGLGLAAARGIVRQHGGRIRIDSEPSRGTVVTIDLPPASNGD